MNFNIVGENMKAKAIIMFLFMSIAVSAQSSLFQRFITRVNSVSDTALKSAIVDSFMNAAKAKGFPYIENNSANFIYRGSASSIIVSGDFNDWGSNWYMTNLQGTDFFYASRDFEQNARLDYKFVINSSNWILDPLNPKTVMGGYGPNSELAMPGYVQPWEIKYNPAIKHGTIDSYTFYSSNMDANYQIKVYLPYYYPVISSTFASIYFQDGFEYIDLASAVNVLDNLLDSMKIEKAIGIFVRPNNRNEEYAGSTRKKYQEFFVKELVPFVDSIYHTTRHPSKRLVLGDSYGGNISALISYIYPDVFGNCGLQSGAFQPNGYEALYLLTSGVKNIKYSSVWGSYEGVYPSMRQLRDYLIGNKYKVDWGEYPEGHSWGLWRANLDKMLTFIFPFNPASVDEEKNTAITNYYLAQNYPNPFNPETVIEYSIPKSEYVKITLHDVLGNTVSTMVNEYRQAGNYKITLNAEKYHLAAGVYFYRLETGSYSSVKKIVFLK